MVKREDVIKVREFTGCGIVDCRKSLEYAETHLNGRDRIKLAICVLESKGIAIRTKMSNDERIDMFYNLRWCK